MSDQPVTEKQAPSPGRRKAWQELATAANLVTIARILLIPAFIIIMLAPWPIWMPEPVFAAMIKPWLAAMVFTLLAATDRLDGYLARSRGEITTFGKFLDPLADKILVAAALLALIELGTLPAWIALVILGREFLVSGLRMVAAVEGKVIAASRFGKVKTVFQIIAVVTFIVKDALVAFLGFPANGGFAMLMNTLAWIVMIFTLGITIASLVDYFISSAEVLGFDSLGQARGAGAEAEAGEPGLGQARRAGAEAEAEADKPGPSAGQSVDAEALSRSVLELALSLGARLGTAESCTGGLVAAALTDIPGSSEVFFGSVVSYANEVKQELLAVPPDVLENDGAVSEACVRQMAQLARVRLGVDYAVATSGIAGPGGGSVDKPVGTVWFAVAGPGGTVAACRLLDGDRMAVRQQSVAVALVMLREMLEGDGA